MSNFEDVMAAARKKVNDNPKFRVPQFRGDMFIWGEGYLSYFTKDELESLKNKFRKLIESTSRDMKYADHGSYGQDRELIEEWERRIRQIEWWDEKYSNRG